MAKYDNGPVIYWFTILDVVRTNLTIATYKKVI